MSIQKEINDPYGHFGNMPEVPDINGTDEELDVHVVGLFHVICTLLIMLAAVLFGLIAEYVMK